MPHPSSPVLCFQGPGGVRQGVRGEALVRPKRHGWRSRQHLAARGMVGRDENPGFRVRGEARVRQGEARVRELASPSAARRASISASLNSRAPLRRAPPT